MKLTITVTDRRALPQSYAGSALKYEDYERVALVDMTAPAFVLAGTLRAIADDVDPQAIQFVRGDA